MDKRKVKKARKRVKDKKEFYEHLYTYLGMAAFFFLLNMFTGGYMWFYWPMLGWGIGLIFHYINVFGVPGVGQLDENWEQRELRKELRKMDASISDEEILDLDELEQLREKEAQKRWKDEDLV